MPRIRDTDLELLTRYLDPNETVEWAEPSRHTGPGRGAVPLSFSLFWLTFSVVWTTLASLFGGLFGAFGIPFILVGIGMLVSNLRARLDRRRTFYVVTDRRALVVRPNGRALRVSPVDPARLATIEIEEAPDGSGSLYFAAAGSPSDGVGAEVGFERVDNVHEAYTHLRRIAAAHAPTRPALTLPDADPATDDERTARRTRLSES